MPSHRGSVFSSTLLACPRIASSHLSYKPPRRALINFLSLRLRFASLTSFPFSLLSFSILELRKASLIRG
ncbi:hypothetical protein FOXYSP1_10211 [Fusarium oxysporum f. sp. phaseoli]